MRTPLARRPGHDHGRGLWRRLGPAVCALALFAAQCDGAGPSNTANQPPGGNNNSTTPSADRITQIYAKSTTQLVVEIDYQKGAEPFTGSFLGMDAFNITRVNIEKLFQGSGATPAKTLVLPNTLAQMEQLTDLSDTSFTGQRILDIAAQHREKKDAPGQATFYILFLNGYYNDGKMVRNDVLGVALGSTGVVAMFKPVINSSTNLQQFQKFVEQTTLVHELGHSIGLVNFGIPLTAMHQDSAHGAHCSNTRCVMYYANEGAAAALQFARDYIITGNEILFDADCQNDTKARLMSAQ
jgi:predicted Zn-dependent protease